LKEAREFIAEGNVKELEKQFYGDQLAFGTAGESYKKLE
jgi:hypothetical protein